MINTFIEIKTRISARLDWIKYMHANDPENAEKMDKVVRSIDKYLIEMNRPHDFRAGHSENIMKDMDVAFENVCASMEEAGVSFPKKLTVFEFNQRIEYFNKKRSKKNPSKIA